MRLDGVAVHLHDPEHRLAVRREPSNGAEVRPACSDDGQVRLAVHDRRDGGREGPALGES